MSSSDPTEVLVEAVIKGAIAEGLKLGTEGVKAGWTKLRELVGKWSGKKKDDVDDALEGVLKKPDSKARQQVLGEELQEVEGPVDEELLAAARDLVELMKADEKTAHIGGDVTQIMTNLSHSAGAQAVGGGDANATVNIGEKKTSESE